MNTERGTVVGEMEGPASKAAEAKAWLAKTGSPKSVIEKAVFSPDEQREGYTFSSFGIQR